MKGRLDKRILVQIIDEDEEWIDHHTCFANVNIASGKEYFGSGAEQSISSTIFEVRYCQKLKDIYLDTQSYRIKFRGGIYDIQDVDNYMFNNESLKFRTVGRIER